MDQGFDGNCPQKRTMSPKDNEKLTLDKAVVTAAHDKWQTRNEQALTEITL